MTTGQWVMLIVAAVFFFWGVGAYNRLVRLKNAIAGAYVQIDAQLKRRHELIARLVELARQHLHHEGKTLEAVLAAHELARGARQTAAASPLSAAALGVLAGAELALGGAMGRLLTAAEACPALQADPTLRELGEELTSTENRLGFARQAYNDQVLEYNDAATQFPTLIVARLFGIFPLEVWAAAHGDEPGTAPSAHS